MTGRPHPNTWVANAIVADDFRVEAMAFVSVVLMFFPKNPLVTIEILCMKRSICEFMSKDCCTTPDWI